MTTKSDNSDVNRLFLDKSISLGMNKYPHHRFVLLEKHINCSAPPLKPKIKKMTLRERRQLFSVIVALPWPSKYRT